MQLTTLNGTPVSQFAFGAMQFGGSADADASRAMYDAARAAGITFFDTAHAYTDGASETFLGEYVAPERDAVFVASKADFKNGSGRDNLRRSIDESRSRGGLDVIDAYYLHRWDDSTALEVSFETLAEMKSEGLIRHIGVSNFSAWQTMKAQAVAAQFGVRIDLIQPMYNLVKRQAEVEILPMAEAEDIAVLPYSPLGGGILTGKYARGESGRLTENSEYKARYAPDWMHDAARAFVDVADEVGTSPATLAVAWVAAHPGVSAPIVSARSVAQLAPSLAAVSYGLSAALYDRLAALTPAPPPATDRLEEA